MGFEGFTNGQDVIDGVLTYSAQAGTISSMAPPVQRTFTVQDGSIQIAGSSQGALTCTSDRLSATYSYKVRAPTPIAAGLDRALAGGASSFSGVTTQ